MHYDEDDDLLTDKYDYLAAPYEEEEQEEAEAPAEYGKYEVAPAAGMTRSNSLLLMLLAGLALAALVAWLVCRRRHLKQGASNGQDQLIMLSQNPDGSTRSQVLPAPLTMNNLGHHPPALPAPMAPPGRAPSSIPVSVGPASTGPLPAPGVDVPPSTATDQITKPGKENVVMQIPTLYAPFQSKSTQQQQQQQPVQQQLPPPAGTDKYGASFDSRPRKIEPAKKKFLPAQTSNMRTFVKAGERFRIPNSNRQHHAKVEKLLPNHKVRDPDSRLGKVHQEWLKKSKLPTRTDIKKAQSIREQEYFNSAPAAVPKFSMDHLRTKLQAPPPPKTPFNQPVNRS